MFKTYLFVINFKSSSKNMKWSRLKIWNGHRSPIFVLYKKNVILYMINEIKHLIKKYPDKFNQTYSSIFVSYSMITKCERYINIAESHM